MVVATTARFSEVGRQRPGWPSGFAAERPSRQLSWFGYITDMHTGYTLPPGTGQGLASRSFACMLLPWVAP